MRSTTTIIMQKIKAYILAASLFISATLIAYEGMWNPTNLPDDFFDLIDEAGGELVAEDIYNEQHNSLKDQVVYLSNGYSGVIVSDKGLLLTNYTPFLPFIERTDSLRNGFTALSATEEIPLSNLYALQLKRTVDITQEINQGISNDYNETVRKQQIDSICQAIYLNQPNQPGHIIQIEKNSNEQYFLYEYARYDDIRLVYIPNKEIAISSNTHAWASSRYAADFCLLRIYTNRDNTPAVYSEFNTPAQNMPHAIVSQNPKRVGDPVFYLGYPNTSERSLLADELEEKWADDSTKIAVWNFLSQYQPIQEQTQQAAIERNHTVLKRMQLTQQKQSKEQEFTYWAANHPHFETALRYGNLLPLLHSTYTNRYHHFKQYRINTELTEHVAILKMASLFLDMNAQNEAPTLKQISKLYNNYQIDTEKNYLTAVLNYYRTVCDTTYFPEFYTTIDKKYKGNTQKYVDYVFKKSFLTDEKRFTKYLDEPTEKQRANDPLLSLSKQLKQLQRLHYLLYTQHNTEIGRSKRLYCMGQQLKDSTLQLADANYTLRLGYGNIQGYSIHNGVEVAAFASLNDRNNVSYLYNLASPLDSTFMKALENDTVYTDFYTTCDAPYGRMGEAVYSVHGELMGIMSQVNPEAAYNTYVYDSTYQRTLVSDIDYLLFLLEHGNGKYLLDEIELGEPEQLVQIQYVTPTPNALIALPDSIAPSDSIMLNDSTLLTDTITVNNDIDLASRIDSTTKRLND